MTPSSATTTLPPEAAQLEQINASLDALNHRLGVLEEILTPLRPLARLAEQAPAAVALAGDAFDDLMRSAMASGIDVERGVLNGVGAALRFGATMDAQKVRELEELLQSGVLEPAALHTVGELVRALVSTTTSGTSPVGLVGLLKALRNPDVQRALGFVVTFAERFGGGLRDAQSARF